MTGEVSNIRLSMNKHLYFSLKDSNSKVNCVFFSYNNSYFPKEGDKVELSGNISLYEKEGRYQIIADNIIEIGKGKLFLKFLQLKNELNLKGYFAKNNEINDLPNKIGIVTSSKGSALQDILKVLQERAFNLDIIVYPVHVQGDNSKYEIRDGINYLSSTDVDTIILARGGGSIEDLWPFNTEIVADAIYNSSVPIISGIGHETDFTISDFVADLRAATPTDAAVLSFKDKTEYKNELNYLKLGLKNNMTNYLKLITLDKEIYNLINRKLNEKTNELLSMKEKLSVNPLKNLEDDLDKERHNLHLISPLNTLNRGYAIINNVNSIKNVKEDDIINIRLKDGIIMSKVKKISEVNNEKYRI